MREHEKGCMSPPKFWTAGLIRVDPHCQRPGIAAQGVFLLGIAAPAEIRFQAFHCRTLLTLVIVLHREMP
jgi:hypothetical protein